jgi:lipoate---protein ligase
LANSHIGINRISSNFQVTPISISHPIILKYEDLDPQKNPSGEVLLSRQEPPYRVWIPSQRFLILGASQDPVKELRLNNVIRDSIPIYKRRSGGGAVLLSSGCLCLGLRFSKRKEFSIQDYFRLGSDLIRKVSSQTYGIDLESRGISDLVAGDRKVAGCAMYMPRDFVLYLVSLLIDPDFEEIEKYLAYPSKEPDYRSGRSHSDFLSGLAKLSTKKVSSTQVLDHFETEIQENVYPYLDRDQKGEPG